MRKTRSIFNGVAGSSFCIFAVVGGSVLFLALMACAGLGDSSWEARRAAAVNRPRTFVYNTDGNDAHNWPSNLPVTVENFTGRRLVHALGTRITTVSYCPPPDGSAA